MTEKKNTFKYPGMLAYPENLLGRRLKFMYYIARVPRDFSYLFPLPLHYEFLEIYVLLYFFKNLVK